MYGFYLEFLKISKNNLNIDSMFKFVESLCSIIELCFRKDSVLS